MNRLVIFLFLLMGTQGIYAASEPTLNELYEQLDEAIYQSPNIIREYEKKIDKAYTLWQRETDDEEKLRLSQQMFELYKAFDNDSALAYADYTIALAQKLHHDDVANDYRALMAYQCSSTGLYTEAKLILEQVDLQALTSQGWSDYYRAQVHLYGELSFYTSMENQRKYYNERRDSFHQKFMEVTDRNTDIYHMEKEYEFRRRRQFTEALAQNDRRIAMADSGSHLYAIVAYYRHLIAYEMGDMNDARRWLAVSALCDVKNAVMDQAALITLAQMLNEDGDLDRSYRYIRFTWDCNNRFNTRMRSWQIAPILNVIEHNYQNKMKENSRHTYRLIVVLSILGILSLVMLIFVWYEKRSLQVKSRQLKVASERLQQKNVHFEVLNNQLSALNSQLKESNRVKEEYIGRFMSLCSEYINKLDDYRKMVQRKMKNKELDELFRISKSTELKEKELNELYANFDSVFLHLFPSFVDDFNALLQPEIRIQPKEDNRLTTDLRIFALIRLGIEDSSKIAEFLHYSVNTIYNYRARIKNGAIGSREDFEAQVKALGLPL